MHSHTSNNKHENDSSRHDHQHEGCSHEEGQAHHGHSGHCAHHGHSGHHDDHQKFLNKIEFLDSNLRKTLMPPEDLLSLVPLSKSSVVLDAGAGSGFLTIPAATLTGNTVYAADLDTRMLDVIKTKMQAKGLGNIVLLEESIDSLSLEDSSVDIVLVSLILHEVPSFTQTLEELGRVLKPGGSILCIEYEKKESSVMGPPMEIRISSDAMKDELVQAGFTIQQLIVSSDPFYIFAAQKVVG